MIPPLRKEERPVAALLAPDILVMLGDAPANVAAETEEMHPVDLADVAEAIPREMVPLLLAALPKDRAADVLEYMDEELRTEVLERMTATQAASLMSAMTPDDRADVLEELEEDHADDILAEIPADARRETEQLLAYDPESAGGIVATVISLTLVAVVVIGTIVPSMLPLLFTKVGFDPAIASSPFVASLVDVAGIVVYFRIAIWLLHL